MMKPIASQGKDSSKDLSTDQNSLPKSVENDANLKLIEDWVWQSSSILESKIDALLKTYMEEIRKVIEDNARFVNNANTILQDVTRSMNSMDTKIQHLTSNSFQQEELDGLKRKYAEISQLLTAEKERFDRESERKQQLEKKNYELGNHLEALSGQMKEMEEVEAMREKETEELLELRKFKMENSRDMASILESKGMLELDLAALRENCASLQFQISVSNGVERFIWPAFMNEYPFVQLKKRLMHELTSDCASVSALSLLAAFFRYRSTPCDPVQATSVSTYASVVYDLSRSLMEYDKSCGYDDTALLEIGKQLAAKLQEGGGGGIKIEVPVVGQSFDNMKMIQTGKPSNAAILKVSRVLSWAVLKQNITLHKAEVEV